MGHQDFHLSYFHRVHCYASAPWMRSQNFYSHIILWVSVSIVSTLYLLPVHRFMFATILFFFSFKIFQRSFRRTSILQLELWSLIECISIGNIILMRPLQNVWMYFGTCTWYMAVECASIDWIESEGMIYKWARVVVVWQSSMVMSQASKLYIFLTPFGQIRFRKYGCD